MLASQMIGPIKISLILLQRAIACIFPLFTEPDSSGLKELGLVLEAYPNILLLKQLALDLGKLGIQFKSTFNRRLMFSNDITPVPDHVIHKAIYMAFGIPSHRFNNFPGLTASPKHEDDEFAGYK
jgi:hypothetical protein